MAVLPTPEQICSILNAKALVISPESWMMPLRSISTDSRNLGAGDGFVALRGDRFDGHGFVAMAAGAGATLAVVDQGFEWSGVLVDHPHCSLVQVADTLVAYQRLGHYWRQQFAGPVVAVTGSVGKTTMKELIAAMLATQGPVLKTQANFNNEIGVPKTLLGLDETHRYAVVEMGMRGLGEIELLGEIAEPDVALITNVGTAHIERLGSEAAIAQAKCELLKGLKPGGVAVLNADNPRLMETAATVWSGNTLTFGLDQGDLRGERIDGTGEGEMLLVEGQRFRLPLPGRHNALNFCGALAVAKVLGVDWAALTDLQLTLPNGRSQRYDLANGIALLDETYNAGAESMAAAIQLLAQTPGERRIAVLGTMKELGEHSLRLHRQVGAGVAQQGIDLLLTLADPAEAVALAEGAAGVESLAFEQGDDLVDHLKQIGQAGDRILFKASRAVALDRVVDQLKAHWS
jgi:UDP-N-acetylmuramoyl-tripeptide--D-alanyl-D-alanine ligase